MGVDVEDVTRRARVAQAEVETAALRDGLWRGLNGFRPHVEVVADLYGTSVRASWLDETGFGEEIGRALKTAEAGIAERVARAGEGAVEAAQREERWHSIEPERFELPNVHAATGLSSGVIDGSDLPQRSASGPVSGHVQLAAAGDLRCEGFSAGCSRGGSFGSTATHNALGRNLCVSCAVRFLGLEAVSPAERLRELDRYLIGR